MREAGLVAVQKRKFKATTDSKHKWPVAPNLLERNSNIDESNKIWVTDNHVRMDMGRLAVLVLCA